MFESLKSLFAKRSSEPAPKILVFAGAGISQESGLSTFRDSDGLWARHRIEDVCDLRTFRKNRDLVFDFYNDRKKDIQRAEPNRAHKALHDFARRMGPGAVEIHTANVDDLFERAGFGYGNPAVSHIHGFINEMNCLECGRRYDIGSAPFDRTSVCPGDGCASHDVKPGIVLFHEQAPLYGSFVEAFQSSGVKRDGKLVPHYKLIIGTSFNVIPKEMMFLGRSSTVLLDPAPNYSKVSDSDFDIVVKSSACSGIDEALSLIEEDFMRSTK